ncbi:MAG: cyclic nucleotide-binding domain-containing protein [Planctomycetota bacterium]
MEPSESLLSEYFLSEQELEQLMQHLIDEQANASTLLAFTDKVEFEPGQVLIREGTPDASVFILTEGTLEVTVDDGGTGRRVATIKPYAIVGEQSFIDGGVRTATVTAKTNGIAHRLTDAGFEQVRSVHPEVACAFLVDVSRAMAQRLRQGKQRRRD